MVMGIVVRVRGGGSSSRNRVESKSSAQHRAGRAGRQQVSRALQRNSFGEEKHMEQKEKGTLAQSTNLPNYTSAEAQVTVLAYVLVTHGNKARETIRILYPDPLFHPAIPTLGL